MGNDWITIATFSTLAQAHLARQHLLDAGIEAAIADVYMGGLGAHADSAGGMKLEVPEESAELARQALAAKDLIPAEELEREALEDVSTEEPKPRR